MRTSQAALAIITRINSLGNPEYLTQWNNACIFSNRRTLKRARCFSNATFAKLLKNWSAVQIPSPQHHTRTTRCGFASSRVPRKSRLIGILVSCEDMLAVRNAVVD